MSYYYANCRTQVGQKPNEMDEVLVIKTRVKTMREAFEKEWRNTEKDRTLPTDAFIFWKGKKYHGTYVLGEYKWERVDIY